MGITLKSDLLKSIGSGYVLFLLTNLVALFLTPFILRYVSKEEYGFYLLCVELFSWLGFVNLGTAKVLGPFVAKELATENQDEIVYLFNSSFWFQLAVSVLTIPLYYSIVIFSGAEKSDVSRFESLILLFAFAAFIQNMSGQFSEMIIATRKIHLDNQIEIITLLLRLILIVILIPLIGIETVFYVYFLIAFVDFTRKYIRVKKLYPTLLIKWSLFSTMHFKNLLSNGVFFTLASLTTILVTKFDQFFLGREVGLELVANYYVTIKLVVISEKLINVFFNNFRPHISRMYGTKSWNSIECLYIELSTLALAFGIFFTIILSVVNQWFVSHWVGEEMFIGNEFSRYVIIFYFINITTLPSRMVLVSTLSFIRHLAIAGFLQGIARIGILLFSFTSIGLNSLPISNIIALLFLGLSYQLLLVSRFFKNTQEVDVLNSILFVTVFLMTTVVFLLPNMMMIQIGILILGVGILLRRIDYNKSITKSLLLK